MIPNKSSFKFQELTPITGVKPYVIRYWETEFAEIDPITSDSGHKIYARKDVEAILKIKNLLFEQRLSIPEAKLKMSSTSKEISNINSEIDISKNIENVLKVKSKINDALELIREIKSKRTW